MADLQRATKRLASASGKLKKDVVQTAAKGFVKTIVKITPPASQKAQGTGAKQAGEKAATADLRKLVVVPKHMESGDADTAESAGQKRDATGRFLSKEERAALAGLATLDPAAILRFHQQKRGHSHRAPKIPRSERQRVRIETFLAAAKILIKEVGTLAAGWVASAAKLGVSIPAWVKRHGGSHGQAVISDTGSRFRIELSNALPFVTNVAGYERRVQNAVNYQAKAMNRQADFLQKKAIREAGWK